MTLCDTGPLVAPIDGGDRHQARCVAALGSLPDAPLRMTWPCLVEAMYLLHRAGGLPAHEGVWRYLENGLVVLHDANPSEWGRMRDLMRRYRDSPMDPADASIVSAAEQCGTRRVFTLDRHSHAYRIEDRHAFEIVP